MSEKDDAINEESFLLEARGIYHHYHQGKDKIEVLQNIDLTILSGEALCITGTSGTGKSTLLQILGTLQKPTQGHLFIRGQDLSYMKESALALFRNQTMGFVFQFHHLLEELTTLENVLLPYRIYGKRLDESIREAETFLEWLGLSHRIKHYPSQLSGGELQRAAIARALICKPKILFADEPTGNLDHENSQKIQEFFLHLHKEMKVALVLVTHDIHFANRFPRVLRLQKGQLHESPIML